MKYEQIGDLDLANLEKEAQEMERIQEIEKKFGSERERALNINKYLEMLHPGFQAMTYEQKVASGKLDIVASDKYLLMNDAKRAVVDQALIDYDKQFDMDPRTPLMRPSTIVKNTLSKIKMSECMHALYPEGVRSEFVDEAKEDETLMRKNIDNLYVTYISSAQGRDIDVHKPDKYQQDYLRATLAAEVSKLRYAELQKQNQIDQGLER